MVGSTGIEPVTFPSQGFIAPLSMCMISISPWKDSLFHYGVTGILPSVWDRHHGWRSTPLLSGETDTPKKSSFAGVSGGRAGLSLGYRRVSKGAW
jgi:hypothetical protein